MSAGAVSEGLTATQRSAPKMACSRLSDCGRIGVADVAAGAIARPARAVVPAARVLRHVAADRALDCGSAATPPIRRPRAECRSARARPACRTTSVRVVIAPISRPSPTRADAFELGDAAQIDHVLTAA